MKPGSDQSAAVRAWLDDVTTLIVQRCDAEWRANSTTALYLWYEPSKPGKWGRFGICPQGYELPGFKLANGERLSGHRGREPFWIEVRRVLNRLPILDPNDMAGAPPKAQLANVWGADIAAPAPEAPKPDPAPAPANAAQQGGLF